MRSSSPSVLMQLLWTDRVVLDKILLGDSTEAVIEEIHEYLTAIGNKIRAGEVPRKDFIINAVCL